MPRPQLLLDHPCNPFFEGYAGAPARQRLARVDEDFLTLGASVHEGGTRLPCDHLCDVADAAMGVAYASTLADGESFTTLELKINFLRPFWDGTLTATARVVKAGRTIGLTECDVTDADGRLIARAMSTCMTLRGDSGESR